MVSGFSTGFDMAYRGQIVDSEEYVYGSYFFHPLREIHMIIEPRKNIHGKICDGLTYHRVDGKTVGMEMSLWCRKGFKRRKFYAGDIIDEGDNFPSIIRFGENDVNGYGFYLEEVDTVQGETQLRRHLVDAYTTIPDKTKVIGHVWSYKVKVFIAVTPDGEFICRNEYERGLLVENHAHLYPKLKEVIFREEEMTISDLDNSFATAMSVEYFKVA